MWTLRNLIDSTENTKTMIGGRWVPSRPVNWKHRTLIEKLKEAWMVFTGKADCFTWPDGQ